MKCTCSPSTLPLWGWCTILALVLVGACKPEEYKVEADKEVYKIIDAKWDDSHGHKANYAISDMAASPNDLRPELPESGILSLSQAVALATAQSREYQDQKEQLYLTALDLTLARHQFATRWFGTIDSSYGRDPADESLDGGFGVGFNRLLANGAVISTDLAIDWVRFLTGDPRTTLGSVLSATITQPLLQGSSREVVQESLTQAERNALYQIRSFNRFRKTFVVSMVTDYFNVLQQLDRVANDKNSYENLLENQKRVEMMADTGRVPRFQEGEVQQSVLQARDRYNSSVETYRSLLDRFKIRLALPTDAEIELDPNELVALETVGVTEPNVSVDNLVQVALNLRLDLANNRDGVDDAARKVVVAADNLGTELDLIGSASLPSSENYNAGRINFADGAFSLGLRANLPFDRKAERNAYRESLINLDARQRNYQEQVDQVKLDVRQAYRDLTEAYTSYQIQLVSLGLAEKRVDMQMILLQEGRATTRNYLDAQDDLLTAQNAKTSALVQFTLAKLRFYRDTGILHVRPDGLWEQPGQAQAEAEAAAAREDMSKYYLKRFNEHAQQLIGK